MNSKEYNALRASGMLYEFFPKATGDWFFDRDHVNNPENLAKAAAWKPKELAPKYFVTEADRELLIILMEEAAEVTQACSKILRFGWEGTTTTDDSGLTNRNHLAVELGDLAAVGNLLRVDGRLDITLIRDATTKKLKKMKKYTKHQPFSDNA